MPGPERIDRLGRDSYNPSGRPLTSRTPMQAEVAEWQTRRSQKPLGQPVWVRLPPSASRPAFRKLPEPQACLPSGKARQEPRPRAESVRPAGGADLSLRGAEVFGDQVHRIQQAPRAGIVQRRLKQITHPDPGNVGPDSEG